MTMIEMDARQVYAAIDKVEAALQPTNMEKFLAGATEVKSAHDYLVERIEHNFGEQQDPQGHPWAPLRVSTMAIRMQQGHPPTPTNVRTGEMFNALKRQFEVRPMGNGVELSVPGSASRSASLTNKLRVAQRGGRAPGAQNDTPPRPVLGMDAVDGVALTTLFEQWIERQIGR